MTNPSNVMVITDRLIAYLRVTRDHYIKSDLVGKVTQLAERFAPDNLWFIQTMNVVFELGEEGGVGGKGGGLEREGGGGGGVGREGEGSVVRKEENHC